jgi:transcriptional regulator with XRE-family HTH domain
MPFVRGRTGEQVYRPMSGTALRDIRHSFGLGKLRFGLLLGFSGTDDNIKNTVRRYEVGSRSISPTIERLALMLAWFKEDFGYLPDLDRGERIPMEIPMEFGVKKVEIEI